MADSERSIVREKNVRPYVSPQQKKQRRITIGIILILAGVAAGAYFFLNPTEETYTLKTYDSAAVTTGSLEETEQASGSVTIINQIEVLSPEEGTVAALYVREGEAVNAGEIVAKIDVPDLEESLDDMLADYETAQLNLKKVKEQNRITNARARRNIENLRKSIGEAETERAKTAKLVNIGSAPQSDLDKAEDNVAELTSQLEEAEIQLEEDITLQNLDIEIREADLERSRKEIDRLEKRIAAASIASPMRGEILELSSKLEVQGTIISKNETLMIVADPESAVVDLELLEQYADVVQVGSPVDLTISDESMVGEVEQIGKVAQASNDGLGATVSVRVKPVDSPSQLLSGATAVGTFVLGVNENTLLLPRGPYLTTGNQRYVYRIDGSTAHKISVTFGTVEGNTIQVLAGLEEGDVIITSGYQNYIEYPTIKLEKGEK